MENRTKMTQEEKDLLKKVLCEMLPYGVVVEDRNGIHTLTSGNTEFSDLLYGNKCNIKPYLRPMSSITDEEFGFLQEHLPYDFTRVYSGKFDLIDDIHLGNSISIDDMAFLLECFNKWHLDYRGLIELGLALKAPKDMYKEE